MRQLAEFCYRRRWVVLIAWIALTVALLGGSFLFAGEYKTEFKLPVNLVRPYTVKLDTSVLKKPTKNGTRNSESETR